MREIVQLSIYNFSWFHICHFGFASSFVVHDRRCLLSVRLNFASALTRASVDIPPNLRGHITSVSVSVPQNRTWTVALADAGRKHVSVYYIIYINDCYANKRSLQVTLGFVFTCNNCNSRHKNRDIETSETAETRSVTYRKILSTFVLRKLHFCDVLPIFQLFYLHISLILTNILFTETT